MTAILAGIISQILEDKFGHIGPFQGAIALTVLALLMVLPWNENYGESSGNEDSTLYKQFSQGWKTTLSNSNVWKIGLTQALSEGAMYTVSKMQPLQLFLHIYNSNFLQFFSTVCVYVGAHTPHIGSSGRRANWLCLFSHDDVYHYRWDALSSSAEFVL